MTLEDLYVLEEIMQEAWSIGSDCFITGTEKTAILGGYWEARGLLIEGLREHQGKIFSIRPMSNNENELFYLEQKKK